MNAELLKAVLLNDLRLLQGCIEKGIDVNEVDENGTSPLHLASFYGYHPIVNALIDARARVDARDREWFTPLQRACFHNHPNTVKILINRGAKPNSATRQFMTSLHICAQVNALSCAEVILDNCDSIIDRPDWGGCPPLHYAASYGNSAFVEFLLKRNTNPSTKNKRGMTAAHWAALNGHSDVLKLLFNSGTDMSLHDQQMRTILHYAAMSGDMDSVTFILENTSLPINNQCSAGYTPLHYAVLNGRSRVAGILISNGANPFIASYFNGFIPLHIAAGFTEGTLSCDLLIEVTHEIGYQSTDGSTALHFACQYGRIARSKSLIAKDIPVNAATIQGVTPLHMASRHGHDLIVKHLLGAGADCSLKTKSGLTALHLAAFHGYVVVARTLCISGANVAEVDCIGRTALHMATQSASSNSEFMIDYLLSTNIPVSKVDCKGCSALHYAARSGFFQAIQKLLAAGACANEQDQLGYTPLHYAVQSPSDLALVSAKILLRADNTVIQVRDKSGFLPVHHAVKTGNLETVLFLIDAMSDATVPSSCHPYHLTLYHIAARYNHAQLLQKLLAFYHARSMTLDKEQTAKISNTIGLEMDSLERIPIHYAMSGGYQRCVDILLRTAIRKRALLRKDCFGITPLHAAAACGRTVCISLAVELLREKDINVLDSSLRTPIMFAISNGFLDCFLTLLPKSDVKLFDKNGRGLMHRACSLRNELLCKELVNKGADFKSADCNGVTPFHIAARSGDSAIVNYLLANGVEETADSTGLTAFDWAAMEGNECVLHILHGVNKDANRSMATILAASRGHVEACQFLLQMNMEYANATDVRGRTALHHAARQGYTKVVSTLLIAGANPSALDVFHISPLMAAASCSDPGYALEIIGLLIEQTAFLEAIDIAGNTVFHHACMAGNEMEAVYLLNHIKPVPANGHAEHIINYQNTHGQTVLHLACKAGMITLIRNVLRISSYSLSLMDDKGRIPLVAAIENEAVIDCMLCMLDTFVGAVNKNGFLATVRRFRKAECADSHFCLPSCMEEAKVEVEEAEVEAEGDFY
ncbi:ankyrin repeat domain protein 28, putative [Brugia malayi]|uniref:Ankyrin repeat domain protein 28, putative n=1 Tax=Brugia malayi TaxID=6279 RepID=A0A0H5SI93_BRUMA|nr:ankyrin repeat domain protein 28, putative [Brugia malayi]CRZ23560.1 Bm9291 [Brugia malayi]VIO88614.1 ankyrin repeat domain protein 28, putative [Brugia malayi]